MTVYGSASLGSLWVDVGKQWLCDMSSNFVFKRHVMKVTMIDNEDFKCNVWINTENGRICLEPNCFASHRWVSSLSISIFIRLHLTDVLSRLPPCRFEIGKCRLKREVVNVPTAVGFSEAVKTWITGDFLPKYKYPFQVNNARRHPEDTGLRMLAWQCRTPTHFSFPSHQVSPILIRLPPPPQGGTFCIYPLIKSRPLRVEISSPLWKSVSCFLA